MKIESASLELAAKSSHTLLQARDEKVRAWVGDRPPPPGAPTDTVTLSLAARAMALEPARTAARKAAEQTAAEVEAASAPADPDQEMLDPRTELLRIFVETLTGRKLVIGKLDLRQGDGAPQVARASSGAPAAAPEGRVGWGIEAEVTETRTEVQQVAFQASGVVRTADGRQITLEVELAMRDETVSVSRATFRAGDAQLKDPLVLNFGGTSAELLGHTDFDLDADGAAETIDFVGPGTGVLTLGFNGEDRPEDGRAVFGARTGDGFAELAAYDDDRNGWIDEADAIYRSLGVWTRDAAGNEAVRSLSEVGVGAISLAHAATVMDVHDDSDGSLAGRVQSTGVFLEESGAAGTIQQVDLASRRVDVVA